MSRALLVLTADDVRRKAADWCRRLPHGTRVEFRAPRRSTDQNALMWQRLTEISEQVVWYGAKLSPEDWKDIMTASLRKARVVPGLDPGTYVPLGMRTSDMTVAEMTDLLALMEAFAAERGVRFRDLEGEAA